MICGQTVKYARACGLKEFWHVNHHVLNSLKLNNQIIFKEFDIKLWPDDQVLGFG